MKKIIGLCLALVLMFAMAGCGGQDADKQATSEEVTTTAPQETETTTTEKKKTYKTTYKTELDTLVDQGGVTGGRLVDMDGDGTPEMLVIQNRQAKIYTIQDGKAVNIYEHGIGIRYGQTDAMYELLLNESITPVTMVIFDSNDEWVNEHIYAVTVSGGAASVEELEANTNGENDTPGREELKTFSINNGSVDAGEYDAEYTKLTTGADSIDPSAADLGGLQAALNE